MLHFAQAREERLRHVAALLAEAYVPASAAPRSVAALCDGADGNEEHLIICPVCGQMIDCRDKDQVAHHNSDDHAPKLFAPERPRSWLSRLFSVH